MTNSDEKARWLVDARDSLRSAERDFPGGEWRSACHNAQLAIELSAKGVISLFCEPKWTHAPGDHLRQVVEQRRAELEAHAGAELPVLLLKLAEDADLAAPWHGWSTYGKKLPDSKWLPATVVCIEEVARDLLERARHALRAAERLSTLYATAPQMRDT